MSLEKVCIFAKSRSEQKKCSREDSSQYKRLTDSQRRVTGTPVNSYACAYHKNNKCKEKFCCCPITWEHSKMLVKCPTRFYDVFDEEGNNLDGYKPGTMICGKCKKVADQHFASHPAYIAPPKRQKVNILYLCIYRSFLAVLYFNCKSCIHLTGIEP